MWSLSCVAELVFTLEGLRRYMYVFFKPSYSLPVESSYVSIEVAMAIQLCEDSLGKDKSPNIPTGGN